MRCLSCWSDFNMGEAALVQMDCKLGFLIGDMICDLWFDCIRFQNCWWVQWGACWLGLMVLFGQIFGIDGLSCQSLCPDFNCSSLKISQSSSSEPIPKSTTNTKEASNVMDDLFVVLESTSTTANSYRSFPLICWKRLAIDDIDPLNGFGKSAPAYDIWLTVSEISLFTQLTRAPPPSRPPPPMSRHISKSERGSLLAKTFYVQKLLQYLDNSKKL